MNPISNRILLVTSLAGITTVFCCSTALCQEKDFNAYPENVAKYSQRIYGQSLHGVTENEPDVRISFWLLKPKHKGPWPLGVFPHGHDRVGHNTTAGVYSDEKHKQKSLAEDRDVAVQAVTETTFTSRCVGSSV